MRRTAALPLTLAILLLGGCASSTAPAENAPSIEAEPAAGETLSGEGYSYTVPENWTADAETGASIGADTLAIDSTDTDGFSDNVNVILSPAGEVTAEQVETLGVDELEGAGATEVTVGERVTVAGVESAHLSAGLSASDTPYDIEQYYLTRDGQTYVVTFSFSDGLPDEERMTTAESVLTTWAWS